MHRTSVHIVVLGASGSGKSSLVQCFVSDSACTPQSPPPSIIPPRTKTIIWEGSPAPLTVRVTDTGAATPPAVMEAACASADAFVICFDLSASGTRESVVSLMESTRARYANAVIMIAGTKRDNVSGGGGLEISAITDRMRSLGVEGLMLCQSLGIQRHVVTLFLNAIKFVFYPVRPLLDPVSSSLTPALSRALNRIFKLTDIDGDGRLSDSELCAYQQRAYGHNLLPQDCVGLMESLLDAGPGYADSAGVSLEGFFYLHKMMVQGGRQESVWTSLSSHGYAPAPSLLLLPSSIPHLPQTDQARLLCHVPPCDVWGAPHTTWRVGGGHRATLTQHATDFIASLLSDGNRDDRAHAERFCLDAPQNHVSPAFFSYILEAGAASPSFPQNEFLLSPAQNCSKPSVHAALAAATAFNPHAVVSALCQTGMACNTVSDALRVQATSQCTENGVVSAVDSPLIVVLLLHGGDETNQSGSDALLQSLNAIGPAILPPRNAKVSPPFPIHCIPSSPPVCVAYANSTNAAVASACILPDIVIFLPSSPASSSSVEASPSPESLSAIVKLRSAVPTVPVLHALNAPAEAVGVCGLLAGSDDVDWMQFAAAASAAVRSISTKPPASASLSSRARWALCLGSAAAVAAGVLMWYRSPALPASFSPTGTAHSAAAATIVSSNNVGSQALGRR